MLTRGNFLRSDIILLTGLRFNLSISKILESYEIPFVLNVDCLTVKQVYFWQVLKTNKNPKN